jgi:uncharacterized membrane protein YidH (DUF202 family)
MNSLSVHNSKLANQRTYLSYFRTGLAIAALSGKTENYIVALYGVLMVILSTIQYYVSIRSLDRNEVPSMIDHAPMIFATLGLFAIYLQLKQH